ncbi:LOW QUALITY PROTEIN: hypothetical protein PHMEG_0005354 [Phytophthora megakarya]|uniref:Uncharacterized protein n=1 Tax=Phytophthora megakarya TaxID=4795 RepID=A0A225WRQ0_9STRA|nr:LOW QUALITY PROTEIN: hypothetical protein PHMEG_0005354 [Phytophthora megakarya]
MDACSFPPQPIYPELQCVDSNLVSMFSRPVLVWIPETAFQEAILCCSWDQCETTVKERVVEDVGCKYNVLNIKYKCSGIKSRGKATTFSTLSAALLPVIRTLWYPFRLLSARKWDLQTIDGAYSRRYFVSQWTGKFIESPR